MDKIDLHIIHTGMVHAQCYKYIDTMEKRYNYLHRFTHIYRHMARTNMIFIINTYIDRYKEKRDI